MVVCNLRYKQQIGEFKKVRHKRLVYYTNGKQVFLPDNPLRQYQLQEFTESVLEPYGFVYCIQNIEDNKRYIGQTTQAPFARMWNHYAVAKRGDGYLLHKAIRKWGEAAFETEILKDCKNQKDLNLSEAHFIKKYKTLDSDYGYNLAKVDVNGSNIMKGTSLYELWVRKHGKEIADEKLAEFKEKQRVLGRKSYDSSKLTNKGNHPSEESKRKLSEKRKGKNNPMYGRNPYDMWVEKFGVEEADKKQAVCMAKREATRRRHRDNSK